MNQMIVSVRDKMLRRIGGVNHFVTHNKDYEIQFQFDDSWADVRHKMAVFAYEDGEYGPEIFDGEICAVPELPKEGRVYIGLKAGDELATELLCVQVCKSANDVITDEYDVPDPKIYEQILDIINNLWGGGDTVYPSPVKFLASPSAAKVGDLIRVKEVDENGDVTRTEGFDVGVALGKKIDAPQTAQVGEVLTVEEVGEDGKPKKWKTQEMDAIRFSEQDLTYDQQAQARKNIHAIDENYNIVNVFGDILKANCKLGVCLGIQQGGAPTGMSFPIIFLYGDSNRGITDLTLYDSKGQVWNTSNSRGEWGPFTLSSNENLIVHITELHENGSTSLVSDTSAEDIYTAIQKNKDVIAVFKKSSACQICYCIDSYTDGYTYNNTFASINRVDYTEFKICGTTLENTGVIDKYCVFITADDMQKFAVNVGQAIQQERMHVTITATGNTGNLTYTADKTFDEILAAINRGIVPTCTYPLTQGPYGPKKVACVFNLYMSPPGASEYLSFTQMTDSVVYECNIFMNGTVRCYSLNRDTSDKLHAPTTAQPGQIVRVKSVDTSGKVTETEAIPHPVLYVTISKTGNTNTSDKTFAEIKSAYDSGRSVFAVVDTFVLPLLAVSDNAACFCATTPDGELHRVSVLITESSVSLAYGSFVERNQGIENAGKILGIDNDGNVVPEDKPVQALAGAAAPTTATAGVVGQEYYVIVDGAMTEMYVCTAVANGTYTWDKVEFGGGYTLPEASATALGGIKADEAQATDTQAVRKGEDGKLYTAPGTVTDAQVNTAVSSWLAEHPEATTTVADGSVTEAKLADKAVTVAKLEKSIADALDIEQHIYTEEKAPLIRYKYNSWVVDESGTNNGIAPILTPSKFRITNPSTTASITMNVQFLDSEDVETATISDAGTLKEQLYWNIPANETVEIETCEYGRTLAKYIRMRWTNYPLIAVDITAIYDSYNMPQPTMDTKSEFITDHKMRWTLHRVNSARSYYSSWCIVPFYPDTEYYVFNAVDPGGNDRLEVYGFPDDTILNEQMNTNNSFADSGGVNERAAIHVYKKILADGYPQKINSSDTNKKWMKIKTKTWDETKGCKYIGVTMGGYNTPMTYPYSSGDILTQDQIKSYFDNINDTYSRVAYISRFPIKIDRHIYSQIVMRNDGLANDEGTYGMALTSQMPSPLANAKWALFGDSLTDTYGGHDLTGNYFASKIAREFNMTLDNRAKSGSNIYRGGSGNYVSVSGMIKLDEFVTEIEAGTTEQPDYITIAFGTNSFAAQIGTNEDTSETDTSVYGATKRFIEALREKCPKSVFGFVLSPKQDWGTNDSQNLRAVDSARTAIKTVCDEYGVPYIDMSTQSGITVAMLPDGIHISNDQSQNLYYHAMRRFMIGL